ncbi:sterol desaturase family protein [Hirschia maritima]|uniref:sterol desaturase family protein n=1 Tax=Hirschia maritima TaxID=1121961 RepID=UPI0003798474|nr:sterol desaturase family protein [Hirschia maritima]
MPEFFTPTVYAIPFFIVTLVLEWWGVKTGRAHGDYENKDAAASLTLGIGNLAVDTLTGGIALAGLILVWDFRLLELPITWWSFIIVFIATDFLYYWKHRLAHTMRWFWLAHVTHHSSKHYNLTTALRQPWLGPFTGAFILGAPLVFLGAHPAFIAFAMSFNLVYQYWIHTEAIDKMPKWFEAIMNTPSHHRVHHATNPRYLDRNYAGVFIIWDKMFGSFTQERKDDPCVFGLVKNVESYNPFYLAYHGVLELFSDFWKDGFRPAVWLKRMISPPGWTPDGKGKTSEVIRQEWQATLTINAEDTNKL